MHEIVITWIFAFTLTALVLYLRERIPLMLEAEWARDLNYAQALHQQEPIDYHANATTLPNLIRPQNFCVHCFAPLSMLRYLPLLGALIINPSCVSCGKPQHRHALAWGSVMLTLIYLSYTKFSFNSTFFIYCILLAALVLLAAIDFDYQLLPDQLTYFVLWLGLLYHAIIDPATNLKSSVLAASTGYLTLWLIYKIHFYWTKHEGMGYGDFKLLAALGAWFGLSYLLPILMIASISALLVAICRLVLQKILPNQNTNSHAQTSFTQQKIAFGPFLNFAAIVCLFAPIPTSWLLFN